MTIGRAMEAILAVAKERMRQVERRHAYTAAHDDALDAGDLTLAAMCYAHSAAHNLNGHVDGPAVWWWPFDLEHWKPRTPREDLIRAAALIIAEIDRIDRQVARERTEAAASAP